MKNIHVIQTDKLSKLYVRNDVTPPFYSNFQGKSVNIYITSDEEIKKGDWVYFILSEEVIKVLEGDFNQSPCKKIILTTDPTLITDGVQSIDDEFLEWFIKNQGCEGVEIGKTNKLIDNYAEKEKDKWEVKYHIYTPKEEQKQHLIDMMKSDEELGLYDEPFRHKVEVLPKEEILANRSNAYEFIDFDKQETLNEVALKFAKDHYEMYETSNFGSMYFGFIEGAKWQQEQNNLKTNKIMKQTAVEFLEEQIKDVKYNPLEINGYSNALEKLFEQAKEMEDENMINFLKSVFQMDGFDYKKALEQFKNK